MIPFFLAFSLALPTAHAADGQITLLITNAKDVAKKQAGSAVVTMASVFMDIDKKTQKVIAKRLTEGLAAQGIQATVEAETISFPSPGYSNFCMWEPASNSLVPVTLAMADYRVLDVDIQNVDEVVASQSSSMIVDVAHLIGIDLKGEVNARAAPILLQQLQAQGINAVAAW